MEKEHKRLTFGSTPIIFLLILSLLCVGVDFFWENTTTLDQWLQHFSSSETSYNGKRVINKTLEGHEFVNFHLTRLVRGEDRRELKSSGFTCDKSVHFIVCVSTQSVRIQTNNNNMTVYVPSDESSQRETTIKPYARQEDELKLISPVHVLQCSNATTRPPCEYEHKGPAVIFSSGNTGNVFHEMNKIIISLYITTKQFQSRVLVILEDYKPSFVRKYKTLLSRLSHFQIMNPATYRSIHCFPGSVVGLKYHDNLTLDSNDIPGGYTMSGFIHFLKQAYGLKFDHVLQIKKTRLLLLSRINTKRFLNEDKMVSMMKSLGFEILVVRSKIVSNLDIFARMIKSACINRFLKALNY